SDSALRAMGRICENPPLFAQSIWTPENGGLLLQPAPEAGPSSVITVYELGDFLMFNDEYTPTDEVYGRIVDMLTGLVATETWVDNGGDTASQHMFGHKLVVKAPPMTHYQVRKLLAQLRDARRGRQARIFERPPGYSE